MESFEAFRQKKLHKGSNWKRGPSALSEALPASQPEADAQSGEKPVGFESHIYAPTKTEKPPRPQGFCSDRYDDEQ